MAIKKEKGNLSFVVSTNLSDVEIVTSNIDHPDVDFVLLFVPEDNSFKSSDKSVELNAVRKSAGDSLIEIRVSGVRYSDPDDPTYSDVEISGKGLKSIVEQLRQRLPEEYLEGKPFGVAVFAPVDICGWKANLDSDWTQSDIGSKVFDELCRSGIVINSVVSMFRRELFVAGFSFEAVEKGIPLTVSIAGKDLYTLDDKWYGEFNPSCQLNHSIGKVDFASSCDFVKMDFLELLSYGKEKRPLKSGVKSKKKKSRRIRL